LIVGEQPGACIHDLFLHTCRAGIIKLMNRDEDMLATIIGHECAHALARHSSEKISLGLFIALAVQVGASCFDLLFN
jgi:Zn-dependent protease with chaperone function